MIPGDPGFRDQTVRALAWSTVGRVGSQLLGVGVGIALARLLAPGDFGIMAMVTVLTGFAGMYAEMGFGAALVQRRDLSDAHLSSVFWINAAGAVVLAGALIAFSPLLAGFYGEPTLKTVAPAVGVVLVLRALATVPLAIVNRALDYRKIALAETLAIGGAGVLSIAMAVSGFGVWSLVANALLASLINLVVLAAWARWLPRLSFEPAAVSELMRFSASHLGSQSLGYWVRNLDQLLIGKVLGSQALGLYGRANAFLLFPVFQVAGTVGRVLFPALSRIQDDPERIGRLYLRAARMVALLTFPLMCGLFVTAEEVVLTVFGPRWVGMIPLVRVFSVLGISQSVGTLVGSLYLSQGRSDLQLKVSLVLQTVVMGAMVVGLRGGVAGVAIAYATASVLTSYPAFRFAGRLVGLRYLDVVRTLLPVFGAAASMAFLVWTSDRWLALQQGPPARLAIQVAVGLVSYPALVRLLAPGALRDARMLARETFGWRGSERRVGG